MHYTDANHARYRERTTRRMRRVDSRRYDVQLHVIDAAWSDFETSRERDASTEREIAARYLRLHHVRT